MHRLSNISVMNSLYVSRKVCVTILLLLPVFFTLAQKDTKKVYDGNKLYYDSNYVHATYDYREAIKLNPLNYKAHFNLGASLYRNAAEVRNSKNAFLQANQKVNTDSLADLILDEAAQNFAVVANSVSHADTLQKTWHNIGNCYLQKKDYDQAITAYKKALKLNPKDEETRYNLAYALKNRKPKDNKGGGSDNNQKQKQNQNQENQKKNQQQQNQISKDEAERILKALMNAEKKNQDKRKQKQENASKSDPEKDW